MIMGVLGVWYNNFFGAQSHALLPYDQVDKNYTLCYTHHSLVYTEIFYIRKYKIRRFHCKLAKREFHP